MGFGDSIVALSSGRLPSGVAVIRISGPQTRFALETMCGKVPEPRTATIAALKGRDGVVLDRGLMLFFPSPASFTGEDCGELHLHGGRAVVAAVLDTLVDMPGLRLAEAGEFTRRAFVNGKLDLVQAEGLADLIAAETEAQRRFAIANSQGAQTALYSAWRNRLIRGRAFLEAELDFADEGDVPGSVSDAVWKDLAKLGNEIADHKNGFHRGEIIRDGFNVAIIGPPNAGKSSLLNALAKRDAAIVSDEPGTTRDIVEVALDIGGILVRVADTAGLRRQAGKVESIGIERALAKARHADLIILLSEQEAQAEFEIPTFAAPLLRVQSKSDLYAMGQTSDIAVSTVSGEGIDNLLNKIAEHAAASIGDLGDVLPSRARHLELLEATRASIDRALNGAALDLELRAEELRLASETLGRITGTVDVEELLGAIFSQFCIGK